MFWKAICTSCMDILGLILASYLASRSIYTARPRPMRKMYWLVQEHWLAASTEKHHVCRHCDKKAVTPHLDLDYTQPLLRCSGLGLLSLSCSWLSSLRLTPLLPRCCVLLQMLYALRHPMELQIFLFSLDGRGSNVFASCRSRDVASC